MYGFESRKHKSFTSDSSANDDKKVEMAFKEEGFDSDSK